MRRSEPQPQAADQHGGAPNVQAASGEDSAGTSRASRIGELPIVEELSPVPDAAEALRAFAQWPDLLFFDSAATESATGRYSFLTADPFEFHTVDRAVYGSNPLANLQRSWQQYLVPQVTGLPPFQGGAAGLLCYDAGRAWERLAAPACDEFRFPALAAGLYDWTIAWDHLANRAWVVSQGWPERTPEARARRARDRLALVRAALADRNGHRASGGNNAILTRIEPRSACHPLPGPTGLVSNFSRDGYLRAVERAIEYVHAGDIFQVNLSQRLLHPLRHGALEIYLKLRQCNPAPFAGFFAHADWAIASSSPERFVQVTDGIVSSRPIKGTRARQEGPEADLFTRDALRESRKDRAENVMIVDLLRNDLSRVCQPGSIQVPSLCHVEAFQTVQHLVSEIRGRLRADQTAWELFRAVFPGGSVTGAPKVRAMQIIDELEPSARGPYCGSLFYAGFSGSADSSILIRTMAIRGGWIALPVGGGIVAQSDPATEYEETLHKARGMVRALAEGPA